MAKKLWFLLFFTIPAVASINCPSLDDLRNGFNNSSHQLSAYIVADFKHANKNPWSIKPLEFKWNDTVWKVGVGPIDANSEKEAMSAAKELVLKGNNLIKQPQSEPNYNHAWCYYTDKSTRPLVFAITPLNALG